MIWLNNEQKRNYFNKKNYKKKMNKNKFTFSGKKE